MLILTSPAKSLDLESEFPKRNDISQIPFLEKTEIIHSVVKTWSQKKLQDKMHISKPLAELNKQRFDDYQETHTLKNSRPALWMYKGDIMREFELEAYGDAEITYAQRSVRFISGFYGLVRPLDLMQAYRLEMKIKLGTKKVDDLAIFWKDALREALNTDILEHNHSLVVNAASQEYAKAIDWKGLDAEVVTVDFKDFKDGKYQTVGIFAKRARGMFIDWCIKHKPESKEELHSFKAHRYRYLPDLSSESNLVFGRK